MALSIVCGTAVPVSSRAEIVPTALARLLLLTLVARPVTTTSSSLAKSSSRLTSSDSAAGTSRVTYPTEVKTSLAPGGTPDSVNLPASLVAVPDWDPFTRTETPGRISLVFASVTIPETVIWAEAVQGIKKTIIPANKSNILFIKHILFISNHLHKHLRHLNKIFKKGPGQIRGNTEMQTGG